MNAIATLEQTTMLEIARPPPPSASGADAPPADADADVDVDDRDRCVCCCCCCGVAPRRTTAAVLANACAHAAPEGRLALAGSTDTLLPSTVVAVSPRWQQEATNCQPSPGICTQRFDTALKLAGRR